MTDEFSLFLFMQKWNEDRPVWRCVYSTAPGNVGHLWTCDDERIDPLHGVTQCSIRSSTSVVGPLPGIVADTPIRVTCPVCGRLGRSLTKKGKIRDHDVPPGYTGWNRLRYCAAGGLTVDEAQRHRGLPGESGINANQATSGGADGPQ